jgi:hypothetical protein
LRAQFHRVTADIADDDVHDIEWKTAGFWQVLLQTVFPLTENYCVTAEAGPDGTHSLRRVDIIVYQCLTGDFLIPVLVVEVKRPSGNIVEAEHQVLDATTTLIDRYMLDRMYGISAFGAHFRGFTQRFARNPRDIATLHSYDGGASEIASRPDYLDVDTPDGGNMFRGFIRMVKHRLPALRPQSEAGSDPDEQIPGVMGDTADPSSSWSQLQPAYNDPTYMDEPYQPPLGPSTHYQAPIGYEMDQAQDPVGEPYQPPLGPSSHYQAPMDIEMNQAQDPVAEDVPGGEADQGSSLAPGPSNQAALPQENRQQVAVRRQTHTLRKDELCYLNRKGHTVITHQADWVKKHGVWEHRGRKTTYWTNRLP